LEVKLIDFAETLTSLISNNGEKKRSAPSNIAEAAVISSVTLNLLSDKNITRLGPVAVLHVEGMVKEIKARS
jgi:hypothetical protein|tara:strand:+ start:256 stop:471 length:216 start_codon:yes stop_codon:yes gene_type:complete